MSPLSTVWNTAVIQMDEGISLLAEMILS